MIKSREKNKIRVCFYYQRDQFQYGDVILALLVFVEAEIGLVISWQFR